MQRTLVVGAGFGLLFGAYFASSFFGWPSGSDLVGGVLLALAIVAAFTVPRWAGGAPFHNGLRFGVAAAAVLLLTCFALVGAGFWSVASEPLRVAFGVLGLLLALAGLAAALACVAWLGGRVVRVNA